MSRIKKDEDIQTKDEIYKLGRGLSSIIFKPMVSFDFMFDHIETKSLSIKGKELQINFPPGKEGILGCLSH